MKIKSMQIRPWMLSRELLILYFAWSDKRMGLVSKLPAILAVFYLISPIDFIPDFIPFFGYVDDLIVVPLLLNMSVSFLPEIVREESMVKVRKSKRKLKLLIFLAMMGVLAVLAGIFFLIRYLLIS